MAWISTIRCATVHVQIYLLSFPCIDLIFCRQPPNPCCIINHGLGLNYKVHSCAFADLSFLSFAYIKLTLLTQLPFCSSYNFAGLGMQFPHQNMWRLHVYIIITFISCCCCCCCYYYYYQVCKAGEYIIGHRGIRICMSVCHQTPPSLWDQLLQKFVHRFFRPLWGSVKIWYWPQSNPPPPMPCKKWPHKMKFLFFLRIDMKFCT